MIPLQGIIDRLRLFPLLEAKWLQNKAAKVLRPRDNKLGFANSNLGKKQTRLPREKSSMRSFYPLLLSLA